MDKGAWSACWEKLKRRQADPSDALVERTPGRRASDLKDGKCAGCVPNSATYAFLLAALLLFCVMMAIASEAAHGASLAGPSAMGEMEAQILVDLIIAGLTVLLNGAVTYGVTMTQLRWLRADVTENKDDIKVLRQWQMNHMAEHHDRRDSNRRDRAGDRGD